MVGRGLLGRMLYRVTAVWSRDPACRTSNGQAVLCGAGHSSSQLVLRGSNRAIPCLGGRLASWCTVAFLCVQRAD